MSAYLNYLHEAVRNPIAVAFVVATVVMALCFWFMYDCEDFWRQWLRLGLYTTIATSVIIYYHYRLMEEDIKNMSRSKTREDVIQAANEVDLTKSELPIKPADPDELLAEGPVLLPDPAAPAQASNP